MNTCFKAKHVFFFLKMSVASGGLCTPDPCLGNVWPQATPVSPRYHLKSLKVNNDCHVSMSSVFFSIQFRIRSRLISL